MHSQIFVEADIVEIILLYQNMFFLLFSYSLHKHFFAPSIFLVMIMEMQANLLVPSISFFLSYLNLLGCFDPHIILEFIAPEIFTAASSKWFHIT